MIGFFDLGLQHDLRVWSSFDRRCPPSAVGFDMMVARAAEVVGVLDIRRSVDV